MTVSGTAVSLARGGGDVVVEGSTEALGPYITAGFGNGSGSGTVGVIFEGGAAAARCGWGVEVRCGVGMGVVMWL